MKAFLARLYRPRLIVRGALCFVTLVVLFYAEENWRGARAWVATKARWEAQGETFDYAGLVPPPVPDAQNLAAMPLFHLELVPLTAEEKQAGLSAAANRKPVALDRALKAHSLNSLAAIAHTEQVPDPVLIRAQIAALYTKAFGQVPPPNLPPVGQVDALYPFITDLDREAEARPSCRFDLDYANPLAGIDVQMTLIADQIPLAVVLRLHAIAALVGNNPEAALADLRTLARLSEGINRDSSLLSGLVLCGMIGVETDIVGKGIALHAWNEGQLVQIIQLLAPLDLLASYQSSVRGELIGFTLPALYQLLDGPAPKTSAAGNLSGSWIPAGWHDFHKAAVVDAFFDAVRLTDPTTNRVYPDRTEEAQSRLEDMPMRPWNMLLPVSAAALFRLPETFARAQVSLDEARIAVALERFRLTHGVWPDTLSQLAAYGLPHPPVDPIDGQPYRYRVQFDGTFLLYSIGWNNTDDEGQIVTRIPISDDGAAHDSHDRVENYGDWVWQPFAPEK